MLLTRKSTGEGATPSSRGLVDGLARGLSRAIPTMDRRKFLRRSGLGLGAGITASQLMLVRKADAAGPEAAGTAGTKVEVKRTVCTHCSVGCAIDAVVENGVWTRQEPVFDSPINLGAPLAQCAPRLSGESKTGSWRTQTPFSTMASTAQPTEQWVHTVRLTSTPLAAPFAASAASAEPIML